MKTIITGAAGFVGFHLAIKFAKEGQEVVGVDNFNSYYNPDLKRLRAKNLKKFNIEVLEFDINDSGKLDSLVSTFKPTHFHHLAAQAGVRIPPSQYNLYNHSNLSGFGNVLDCVIRREIPNFIYASSSSVYGDSSTFPLNEDENNLRPKSYYGATKLCNEILAKAATYNSNIKSRGLRFFTVYGEYGRPDMAYFLLANAALNGSQFKLFGDGNIERDFTYIDDNIESIYLLTKELTERNKGFSDVVNIGGGSPSTMNELIMELSKILGNDIEIIKSPTFSGDVRKTIASTSYQEKLIGKIPSTPLKLGLRKFANWAQEVNRQASLENWI